MIQINETGRVDERDSAFPQIVQLPNGDILCSFSVGGGANVTGGTELALSRDGGRTWQPKGVILAPTTSPVTCNYLRLSIDRTNNRLFAYGSRTYDNDGTKAFGEKKNEPIICSSDDWGETWSPPVVIDSIEDCPLEISHGVTHLSSGRMIAPAATLPSKDKLGETVYLAVSDDHGQTWSKHVKVFHDPAGKYGFFEHKFCELSPGRVMGVCWTVTLGDSVDQENHFVISDDNGDTWSTFHPTGIMGQTMTPFWLGDDRLLVLYNRRYGQQGVVALLVRFTETSWQIEHETLLYDAKAVREREQNTGIDELKAFAFGFPTAIALSDGQYLATHWSVENDKCGIRWTRFSIN